MKRRVPLTGAACAALALLLLTLPPSARGEDLTFFPEIDWSEASAGVGALTQTNQNTLNGRGSTTRATYLYENINAAADGHVYHPRFMLFHMRLWGGYTQQYGTAALGTDTRFTEPLMNYELRAIFLPEHPYNLELFKIQQQSNVPGTYLRFQNGTFNEEGANFNYKSNPFFAHASYVDTSTESPASRTDARTYRLNGTYAGSLMSDTAAYSHTDSISSYGVQVARDEYSLANTMRYVGAVLNSRINDSATEQLKTFSPDFHTDTLYWTEQLTAALPANFTTGLNYNYVSAVNRTGAGAQTPGRQEFNRSNATSFMLSHRLYQSLGTNYSRSDISVASSSGEVDAKSQSLGGVYTKSIPFGRLTAGVTFMNADSERTGTVSIINEAHKAALLGTFTLSQRNVFDSTIVLQVTDPVNGSLVVLPPSGYLVFRAGDSIQITVLSVAPLTPQPDPLYVYEFQASYSLADQSKTEIRSQGYSVKLDLVDNLLSIYFNYFNTDQEVLSGSLSGGGGRETSKTVGMTVQSGTYSGLIEHQQFSSWLNPFDYWKTTGQYRSPLAEDANITAQFSYVQTDYFALPSIPGTVDRREKRLDIDFTADKRFPRDNLSLFVTTSYIRNRALIIDSDTLSINGYVTWQVGLLTINGGAQVSRAESTSSSSTVVLVSQYYYVNVSRKLF